MLHAQLCATRKLLRVHRLDTTRLTFFAKLDVKVLSLGSLVLSAASRQLFYSYVSGERLPLILLRLGLVRVGGMRRPMTTPSLYMFPAPALSNYVRDFMIVQ